MIEKRQKTCSSCETKYKIECNIEVQYLEPLTCPFCGHEVEELEDEEVWSNEVEAEDDSWN